MVKWLLRLAGGAALALALTACPGGGGAPPPPSAGNVSGYVVAYNAGPGVEGATVEIYQAGTTTLVTSLTTEADGSFTVELPDGAYDFVVTKPGYAGSKVENFRVKGDTRIAIIQRKAFNPNWPTDPPEVTLEGPEDGARYDASLGFVPYRVRVQPTAPLSTDLIYAALGKTPGSGIIAGIRDFFSQTNDTGQRYIDPLDYGTYGPTTFQVVVYDTNGNRTQVYRHIQIDYPVPETVSDLQPPQIFYHLAVTLGKPVEFFQVEPQGAPEGGNLWVELSWRPQTDFSSYPNNVPTGYHIYRSFDGENWERIASVADFSTFYLDASPELAPGKEVRYRVTAFAGNQESAPSNEVRVTPLDAFAVNLLSPTDGATGVSVTPTFEWAPTQTVSDHHYYLGVLWDTETGEYAYFANAATAALVNRTQWTWNEDGAYNGTPFEVLQRGRTYEWNLIEAYALDDPIEPHAVSIASDQLGFWWFFGRWFTSSQDHFSFTTAP